MECDNTNQSQFRLNLAARFLSDISEKFNSLAPLGKSLKVHRELLDSFSSRRQPSAVSAAKAFTNRELVTLEFELRDGA